MTERKKRPKKKTAADYRKRKHTCTFYLSDAEHAALERITADRQCSAAEFLRRAIMRAARPTVMFARTSRPARLDAVFVDPRQLEIEIT